MRFRYPALAARRENLMRLAGLILALSMLLAPCVVLARGAQAARDLADAVPSHQALWIPLGSAPAACAHLIDIPTVLTLPSNWTTGDAVVVVVGRAWAGQLGVLADALLRDGAAVLELNPRPASCEVTSGSVHDFSRVIEVLHHDVGAGLAVLVVAEDAAEIVIDADPPSLSHSEGGARFHAAVVLGPGWARVAAGITPPDHEGWPARARLLCRVVGMAAASDAGSASQRDIAERCAATLLAPPPP
jgi:hypothetical protein